MLSFIARYSTLIMPLVAVIGFIFPNFSNAVLVCLPQVLFFYEKNLYQHISSIKVCEKHGGTVNIFHVTLEDKN